MDFLEISPIKRGSSPQKDRYKRSGTKGFFEEIKLSLLPHQKALLIKEDDTLNQTNKTDLVNNTTILGESFESTYFSSTPGKEVKELLKHFGDLRCSVHSIRQYDHICTFENCEYAKILLCPQCLLEDEGHTRCHKSQIKPLEVFLSQKIESLSGESQSKRVRRMMRDLINIKDDLDITEDFLVEKIENDFNEIESNVRAYCQTIKEQLCASLKQYGLAKTQELKNIIVQLQEQEQVLLKEQEDILKDLNLTINFKFDFLNEQAVNSFIKKIKIKKNTFSIESLLLLAEEQISMNVTQQNFVKSNAYKSEVIQSIKKSISNSLEQPLANKQMLNFSQNAKIEQASANNSCTCSEKRIEIQQEDFFKGGQDRKLKFSITNESISQTTHKTAINSIVAIDSLSFACVSNDSKLKIFGVTPTNLILYEKGALELNDLCLSLAYAENRCQLLCSMSKGTIELYDIKANIQTPTLIRSFIGHERIVRGVSIIESLNGFVSISHDQTLKLWNWDNSSPISSNSYDLDARVIDSNERFILIGSYKDSNVLVFEIDNSEIKVKDKIKGIPMKNFITCLSLYSRKSPLGLCGGPNGTVYLINAESQQVINKFDTHRNKIFSLIPILIFNDATSQVTFTSASWEGKVSIQDDKSDQIISSCEYQLSNDKKKHWNTDGIKAVLLDSKPTSQDSNGLFCGGQKTFRLFSIGNDDRNIQIFKLTISHL